MDCFRLTGTSEVGVGRLLDALAFFQHRDMLREQAPFKSVRMVEIDILALFHRYMTTIFIIRILGEQYYFTGRETFNYFPYDGGLS